MTSLLYSDGVIKHKACDGNMASSTVCVGFLVNYGNKAFGSKLKRVSSQTARGRKPQGGGCT